jgi:hypothetical protein
MRKIEIHPRKGVLGRFSHPAEFDHHEKIPSVEVIEILLAVRGSLVNVRVNIGSRQCHSCDTCTDGVHSARQNKTVGC